VEFTGERYVPETTDAQISYEHWHRYLYARKLVRDRAVLDLGSGEGYGSYILALHAREVVGLDLDAQTIQHASSRYQRRNLRFELGSATQLPEDWTDRFDAVISFAALSPDTIGQVVDKFVLQLEEQLADRNVTIELDASARNWLAVKGYDPLFGARPLARVIQEHIKKPLAEELLFGKLAKGGTVRVYAEKDADKLSFAFEPKPPAPSPEPKEAELVE